MSFSCCSVEKRSVMLIAFLFTIFFNFFFLSDSFRICDKLSSHRSSFKKSIELYSSLLTKNTFQVGNQSFNLYQQQNEAKYLAFDDFPEGNKFAALDSSRQKPSLLTIEELKSKFLSTNKDKKISFKGGFPFLRLAMPLVILKDTHVVLVDQNNELTNGAESQEIYVTEQELKRAWAESSTTPMGKRTELFSIEESLLLIPDEDDDDILTDYESSGLLATEGIAIPSDPAAAASEAEIFITSEELERIWNEQSNIPLSLPQKQFDIQSSLLLLDTDDDDVEYETRLRLLVKEEEEEEMEDIDQRIWEYEEMGGEDLEEEDVQGDVIVDVVTMVKPTEYVDSTSNVWTDKEKDTYWKNYAKRHSPEEAEILQKLQEDLDDRSENRNAWKKRDNFLTPDIETQSFFGDINNGNIYLTQRIPAKWVDFEEDGMTDGYKSTGTMAWPGENETDYNQIIKPWEKLDLPVRQILELEFEDLRESLPDYKKKVSGTTPDSGIEGDVTVVEAGEGEEEELVDYDDEIYDDDGEYDDDYDYDDYDYDYDYDDYEEEEEEGAGAGSEKEVKESVSNPGGSEEAVNAKEVRAEDVEAEELLDAYEELYEDDADSDDFDYDDLDLEDYDEDDIDTLLQAVISDLKDMTGNSEGVKAEEAVTKKSGKKKKGEKVVDKKKYVEIEVKEGDKSLEDEMFDEEMWGEEVVAEDEVASTTSSDEIDWSAYDLSPTVGLTNDMIEPLPKTEEILATEADSNIDDLLLGGANQISEQIDVESFFRSMNLDEAGGDDGEVLYQNDNVEDSEKYVTEYVDTMRASRKQPVPWTTPREWISKPEFADHVGFEEWGSYDYISKDDMWNDDDIMTAIAIDHVVAVTDTYLFDHSKYSRRIDDARYWERQFDNLITGKADIKEPIPPHLTPDKDRGVEYSDEIIEMKGKISLLPYYPPPEVRWADNVFTPNEDLSPLSMIGTVRSQFEWTPRGDEEQWEIEPAVVERIRPVLELCNHIAKLKSTKGNVLVFQYEGTMRHIVGIHAMMLETAQECFPEIVELRLETVRESDHHDI